MINDKKRLHRIHGHLYSSPDEFRFTSEIAKEADELFKEALDIANKEKEKDLLNRIEIVSLPIEYLKIVNPFLFKFSKEEIKQGGSQDQYKRLEKFLEIYRKNGFAHIREWEPLEDSEERLRKIIAKQIGE